jgi:REP element-mobilizing transposase RayT
VVHESVPPRGSEWVDPEHHEPVLKGTSSRSSFIDNSTVLDSPLLKNLKGFLILIMWNDTDTPLAYFISFRSYGTWLHGDARGSIDRRHNVYGMPYMEPSKDWQSYNQQLLKAKPFFLNDRQRQVVEDAIRETCRIRRWTLLALNVRTNHVHVVVSAKKEPELVLNAFKANATRRLREERLWPHKFSPWAFKGSKRRLWNEKSVERAIDYVLYGQGDDPPDFDD